MDVTVEGLDSLDGLPDDSPEEIEARRAAERANRRADQAQMAYNSMAQQAAFENGREAFIQAIVTGIGKAYFTPPPSTTTEESSGFPEGKAVIWWPRGMSKESYYNFKEWVDLVLRKVARASGISEEPEKE